MLLDGTLSLHRPQSWKKNDTQAVGGIRLAPVKTEKSQFSIQALLLNDCKLLSVLIDTIIMTNVFNGMDYW